jgi:transposase
MLGMTKMKLAVIYCKDPKTIANWIARYETTEQTNRRQAKHQLRKFNKEQQQWLLDYYATNPLAFLDEAKSAFEAKYQVAISVTSIWTIIRVSGLTWKTIERRAIHIKASIFQPNRILLWVREERFQTLLHRVSCHREI